VKERTTRTLLVIVVTLFLSAVACTGGGGSGTSISNADLTATSAAQEWHAQLTAIATMETPAP
jgi:hypothetical protein